jgi:serine/threonine protein kinase HipA of HipAB toxin-antitoxin module
LYYFRIVAYFKNFIIFEKQFKKINIMNAENFSLEEMEIEKNELLEEFQMEELEQRFEMRVTWFDDGPQTPGTSQGTVTISL